MKYFYILICLVFTQQNFAQIQYSGCSGAIAGPYPFTLNSAGTTLDGGITRNTYQSALPGPSCGAGVCAFRIIWNTTSDRWEIEGTFNGGGSYNLLYYNTSTSQPNPPSTSLGAWVDGSGGTCSGSGNSITTLTGDVQSMTLNTTAEIFTESKLSISPNPANDYVSIVSNKETIESVSIFNLLGKRVITAKNNFDAINLTQLQANLYLIKVTTTNGNVVTKKLIKN